MICAATVAELTGSILWGVYSYRLHNLPTFVPPAHGLVFMAGLRLERGAQAPRTRALVAGRRRRSPSTWGVLGLTVLPRTDAAGALGVPLLARLPLALARTRRLRRRLRGRRRARALRDGDRDVALGGGAPGSRHPRRQPARAVSRRATSGSTSWRCCSSRASWRSSDAGPASVGGAVPVSGIGTVSDTGPVTLAERPAREDPRGRLRRM